MHRRFPKKYSYLFLRCRKMAYTLHRFRLRFSRYTLYHIYHIYIYITLVAIYSFQFQMKISISATFTLLHARIRYYDGALHFTSSYVTCDLPVFRPNFSNPIAYRDKNLLTNVSVIYRYQSILRTVLRKIVYFLSIEVSKITITRTGY